MTEFQPNMQPAGVEVDVEREHNFDGITEFDNQLPRWWLWSFYLACIFSVLYWFSYHTFGFTPLPGVEYQREMAASAAAEEAGFVLEVVTDDGLRELSQNPDALARGQSIFMQHCLACHKADGSGSVGPNLTDRFWVHGGSPMRIYETVTKGVIAKGMIPWEPVLGAAKCQQVVAHLLSLRNQNLPGKEAEGDEYSGN